MQRNSYKEFFNIKNKAINSRRFHYHSTSHGCTEENTKVHATTPTNIKVILQHPINSNSYNICSTHTRESCSLQRLELLHSSSETMNFDMLLLHNASLKNITHKQQTNYELRLQYQNTQSIKYGGYSVLNTIWNVARRKKINIIIIHMWLEFDTWVRKVDTFLR